MKNNKPTPRISNSSPSKPGRGGTHTDIKKSVTPPRNKPPIKKKGSVSKKKLTPSPKVSKYWDDKKEEENTNTNAKNSAIPLVYPRPLRVNNLKQARKLLSRMIYLSQIDAIEDKKAKSITYLLSVFISLVREGELEQRLKVLEGRLGTGETD